MTEKTALNTMLSSMVSEGLVLRERRTVIRMVPNPDPECVPKEWRVREATAWILVCHAIDDHSFLDRIRTRPPLKVDHRYWQFTFENHGNNWMVEAASRSGRLTKKFSMDEKEALQFIVFWASLLMFTHQRAAGIR
jgi:hypothetical protein